MRALLLSILVKRDLVQKVKLLIYWSIFVPTLTYDHEVWVLIKRTISRIQVDKMGFLWSSGVHRLFEGQGRKEKKGTYSAFLPL